jgi:hypothetical protein
MMIDHRYRKRYEDNGGAKALRALGNYRPQEREIPAKSRGG